MKAVAVGLALVLAGGSARQAHGAQYIGEHPAPAVYEEMPWVYQGQTYPGYWFSEKQVQRIEVRIRTLEDKAALECFNKTQEANKALLSKPLVIIGAAAAVGLVVGILVGTRL